MQKFDFIKDFCQCGIIGWDRDQSEFPVKPVNKISKSNLVAPGIVYFLMDADNPLLIGFISGKKGKEHTLLIES